MPANVKLVILSEGPNSFLDLKYSYNADFRNTYTVIGDAKPIICNLILISNNNTEQPTINTTCTGSLRVKDIVLPNDLLEKFNKNNNKSLIIISAFIASYNDTITCNDLINNMKEFMLLKKSSQIPQILSGKLVEINSEFLLAFYE